MNGKLRVMLLAAFLVCVLAPLAAAADLAGSYTCRGTNPNGTPYAGTVQVVENGPGYTLRWSFGHDGTAILTGQTLSVSFGVPGGAYGVVVYQVQNDGRLIGKWMNPSGGAFGTETLTPR